MTRASRALENVASMPVNDLRTILRMPVKDMFLNQLIADFRAKLCAPTAAPAEVGVGLVSQRRFDQLAAELRRTLAALPDRLLRGQISRPQGRTMPGRLVHTDRGLATEN